MSNETSEVWYIEDNLSFGAYVIAPSANQAVSIYTRYVVNQNAQGYEIIEVRALPSNMIVNVVWDEDTDPVEYNQEEDTDTARHTCKEWVETLGEGMLAVAEGGCGMPCLVAQLQPSRCQWKRSRKDLADICSDCQAIASRNRNDKWSEWERNCWEEDMSLLWDVAPEQHFQINTTAKANGHVP